MEHCEAQVRSTNKGVETGSRNECSAGAEVTSMGPQQGRCQADQRYFAEDKYGWAQVESPVHDWIGLSSESQLHPGEGRDCIAQVEPQECSKSFVE